MRAAAQAVAGGGRLQLVDTASRGFAGINRLVQVTAVSGPGADPGSVTLTTRIGRRDVFHRTWQGHEIANDAAARAAVQNLAEVNDAAVPALSRRYPVPADPSKRGPVAPGELATSVRSNGEGPSARIPTSAGGDPDVAAIRTAALDVVAALRRSDVPSETSTFVRDFFDDLSDAWM